jgi:hypothetical protein
MVSDCSKAFVRSYSVLDGSAGWHRVGRSNVHIAPEVVALCEKSATVLGPLARFHLGSVTKNVVTGGRLVGVIAVDSMGGKLA